MNTLTAVRRPTPPAAGCPATARRIYRRRHACGILGGAMQGWGALMPIGEMMSPIIGGMEMIFPVMGAFVGSGAGTIGAGPFKSGAKA